MFAVSVFIPYPGHTVLIHSPGGTQQLPGYIHWSLLSPFQPVVEAHGSTTLKFILSCPHMHSPKCKDTHLSFKILTLQHSPSLGKVICSLHTNDLKVYFPYLYKPREALFLALVYLRNAVLTFSTKMAASCLPCIHWFFFLPSLQSLLGVCGPLAMFSSTPPSFLQHFGNLQSSP